MQIHEIVCYLILVLAILFYAFVMVNRKQYNVLKGVDLMIELAWYWWAGIVAAVAYIFYYFYTK